MSLRINASIWPHTPEFRTFRAETYKLLSELKEGGKERMRELYYDVDKILEDLEECERLRFELKELKEKVAGSIYEFLTDVSRLSPSQKRGVFDYIKDYDEEVLGGRLLEIIGNVTK